MLTFKKELIEFLGEKKVTKVITNERNKRKVNNHERRNVRDFKRASS